MQLINIGNSRGIRIPQSIIKKYGFTLGIELIEESDCIKLIPIRNQLRQNWSKFYTENTDVDSEFLECGIEDGIE